MKTIKDSVHDHITVDGVARALLDTPTVQRLRRVKQLGTVQLVYPSANHTRFEHSLGVYHLACQALTHLGIEGPQAARVEAAALLHDIGHGPFSHNLEAVIHRQIGRLHDDVYDLVDDPPVGAILRDHDLGPDVIADMIAGQGKYGALVSGELDVDRMDYLVRDAHHTGVPYGTIDHGRLVRELTFRNGDLVLAEGNVQTAESLLVARALMNPTVYNHHVARIGKSMIRRAAERLVETDVVSARELRRMDDHSFMATIRDCAATATLARRCDHRNLFKRAVWAELEDVPQDLLRASHDKITEYERTIADRVGIDPESVVVDIPERPDMTESSSRVLVNGEVRRLDRQSPLVDALRAVGHSQWRLGVYAPEDPREAVGSAAVDVLGLEIDGALVSDVRDRGLVATLDQFRDVTE